MKIADETVVSIASNPPGRTGFAWMLALLLLLPAAKAVLADSIDPDFFWHVRVADQLLQHGIGEVDDPFSFMSNAGTWTPFSWLGELFMKWTYDGLGLPGIVGVHAACSVIFFAFIALSCREATRQIAGEPRPVATLVSTAFAMGLSLAYLSFRPVTMALALMSVMIWLVWRDRRTQNRAIWLLVPATIVLTNLHLYVILFVVALWARTAGMGLDYWRGGMHWTSDPRRVLTRAIIVSIACSLAALCTPLLPGCIRNAAWFNGEDPMVLHRLVSEIIPFHDGVFGKLLLVSVIAVSGFALRAWKRIGFEHLFCLLAASWFLFQMGRFATVYAMLAMPIAAATLPMLSARLLDRRSIQFAAAALSILMAGRIIYSFPRPSTSMDTWLMRMGDADNLRYPTAAATFVETHVPHRTGRLLNELTWGGYLIWRLGDRYQVFMDGRTLIYPASFWESLYLRGDQAKQDLLASQTADAAILPQRKSLLRASLIDLGWQEAYSDANAVVLVPPATASIE